ncbi:MAG: TetR family transcriptional regulator [Lysobacteraceae bacterium]|nr:MAG: TetR family transcriptional regulator [Xanthomonadaceae bacterium]
MPKPPVASRKIAAQAIKKDEQAYHHGNLRTAIIDATLAQVEEHGINSVSVREIAKRLGVSPGAPFRHFANKKALLTAVATEAMEGFSAAVHDELGSTPNAAPSEALRAIGRGYLRWALGNRAQFAIISNRDEIDFLEAPQLYALSDGVMQLMNPYIQAMFAGSSEDELVAKKLVCRGLVYGLARMAVDGHFDEWNIQKGKQLHTVEKVLDQFIAMITHFDQTLSVR